MYDIINSFLPPGRGGEAKGRAGSSGGLLTCRPTPRRHPSTASYSLLFPIVKRNY
jgi:hypothetical protein